MPEKRLFLMGAFENPSKRMRLDLPPNDDDGFGNDDLWGADDITAEEFDMLQTQATQAQHAVEDKEQKQYEMEGKIKLLNESLTKLNKELREEKLKKKKLISEKHLEFIEKEKLLQKEINKLQSTLEFKNQEMKTIYDKVNYLQIQLQNKKEEVPEVLTHQKKNSFLDKFQFEPCSSSKEENTCKKRLCRKSKLLVDSVRGVPQGLEVVASMFCNRLSVSETSNLVCEPFDSRELSIMSVNDLRSRTLSEELFYSYRFKLKNHTEYLKKNSTFSPCGFISPSVRLSRKDCDQKLIISCLQDLAQLFSCSQFVEFTKHVMLPSDAMIANKQHKDESLSEESECSQAKIINTTENSIPTFLSIFESLFCLINPASYPSKYSSEEEIQWSVATLLSWCTSAPKHFLCLSKDISFYPLISCLKTTNGCQISLKVLIQLCPYKEFLLFLRHSNECCVLCSVAEIALERIATLPTENVVTVHLVIKFFSVVFTIHSFAELHLESMPCSSTIVKGVVSALESFIRPFDEKQHECVLRNGFYLIHLLSRCIPKFKERRGNCEDLYISFMGGLLTLCREKSLFKDLCDFIHDLWDFQEDTSEFEVNEDSPLSSDVASQNSG